MKLKSFVLVVSCLVVGFVNYAKADLPVPKVLRKQLLEALEKRSLTDSLYKILIAAPNKSPINTCYLGVVEALKAKHAWNPYYKLKYLNAAETSFAQAIGTEPHNLELRLLRFSVEHYVPAFLGYTKHLADDKAEMLQLVSKTPGTADPEMARAVIKFLIESKRCTPAENEILQKHLTALK